MCAAARADDVLKVCADPNNLPQSNQRGEGYENKIAQALARDLGRRVEYTFFPQRIGFVRNTLRERDQSTGEYKCDVIIGVPKGYELTATTEPYMRSTYALLFPARSELRSIQTPEDLLKLPEATLRRLRVGVFARSPGSDWLLSKGLAKQAVYYPEQSGDPAEHPARIVGRELAEGKIQLAIVWGPVAGYLTREHAGSEEWRTVPFKPDPRIKFDYEISMGVRFGEKEWKTTLDRWIDEHRGEIHRVLDSYGIPLVDNRGNVSLPARAADITDQDSSGS